ncbi:histidine kinase dimerization/phospho-acceptor domain-containing protein, partial [Falsiroseomonas oryziterrae]|uniref:histidine kinase dimerization/phospho-acceptor domain-containing protein n=1 Tax=Falsiroseomonas oryziterrae TaxID=2911368 RepID=UPI001F471660
MDTEPSRSGAMSGSDLVRLRHDRLRRTAPAVQHEVNNALMVLTSNLELLGRSAPEGPARRQLDRAQEAVRRMETTVRGFLDAARREAEDQAVVAPDLALRQALPLLRVVLGARFGIEMEAGAEAAPVHLDRARLDLALLSLVRDAAARMQPGARIVARVENRDGEVALHLALPPGAAPEGETAMLLAEAAGAT